MNQLRLMILFFCSFVLAAKPAYAYLDPGSGSMILQVILAGLAGAALVIKMLWHRILTFFRFRKVKEESEELSE